MPPPTLVTTPAMETPPTKGPSRRPHTKTRLGCNTCKSRKVRCDQVKPVCQNCTRGNRTCVYSSSNQGSGSSPSAPLSVTPAEAQDLQLMHYYTVSTYQVIARRPEYYWIWQVEVPQLAFSQKCLLHGLLSITAMHRCHNVDGSELSNLTALTRYHQQHALALYIPLLQRIDSENCHALFAFSIVLTLLSFGTLRLEEHTTQSLIHGFTDACDSMFGAAAIATQAAEWLPAGPLGQTVTVWVHPKADLSDVDSSLRSVLEPLMQCADSVCEDARAHHSPEEVASRHMAYRTAILALARSLHWDDRKDLERQEPDRITTITSWAVMTIQTTYLKLLKERDPLALVILGNYGAALRMAGSLWVLEGLGQRITEAVICEVDPGWHPLLAWARSVVSVPHTPAASSSENNT